ncbi:SWIM zinc finger family protein [Nocardioides sp. SYSU D00038]|uniref:SWIM zinc finger family protein n=1 Tax=Nocardioides sp. SYSU D00038 TaxID=2812554 RepID=UPI0019687671|nr:SWIM zinc finger family protein [Nocardioides sp. SYSU D00038]
MTEAAPRAVVHPRQPPRRGPWARRWWGKAWLRAVEEAAYHQEDLVAARTLARGGHVGQVLVEPGRYVASVDDADGLWTLSGSLPVLDDGSVDAFVEAVAAEAGRIAALLSGDLPHALVEHAEEAGVELLPYGGELGSACTCEAWADPCAHALAVLLQLTWLVEHDPFVLLHLRGVPREELLARLHEREGSPDPDDAPPDDLDTGVDAALRAARALELLAEGRDVDHLL